MLTRIRKTVGQAITISNISPPSGERLLRPMGRDSESSKALGPRLFRLRGAFAPHQRNPPQSAAKSLPESSNIIRRTSNTFLCPDLFAQAVELVSLARSSLNLFCCAASSLLPPVLSRRSGWKPPTSGRQTATAHVTYLTLPYLILPYLTLHHAASLHLI